MARKVSVAEITKHNLGDDIWITVNGKVYDMTAFAPAHPGGSEVIYRHGGKDASREYNEAHSPTLIERSLGKEHHIGSLDTTTITEAWGQATVAPSSRTAQADPRDRPSLDQIINLDDFERAAHKTLSEKSWAFVNGGSNDNITRDANNTMLRSIWLRPAVMRDVRTVSTKTRLFGCDLDLPIYISPTGAARMAGPEGEIALARGAAASGIIHCFATPASFPHDEILQSTPQQAFFQLYVNKERQNSEVAIRQVMASKKVKALFVTVDVPVISKREADERIKSFDASGAADKKGAGFVRQASSFIDPAFTWDDLAWLRSVTDAPIVVKGIQRSTDAILAMRCGCHGIVLSNHGGRAADTAPPAILTLLELQKNCPGIFGAMEVLVDGGFRRGSDVVKAICLGASAVGFGRSFLYALGYGQEGIERVVQIIRDEIETAMRLCGMTDLMRDACPDYANTAVLDCLVPPLGHPYARKIEKCKVKL